MQSWGYDSDGGREGETLIRVAGLESIALLPFSFGGMCQFWGLAICWPWTVQPERERRDIALPLRSPVRYPNREAVAGRSTLT